MAQNWLTSGNALSVDGTLGSTTNFSVLFKSNNSERGRLTNGGLWGFGTTAPNSKVHINSASGQNPLQVQVNASTKFLVHSGGGVSIGSSSTPPVNGLYVSGSAGIGTASPQDKLHVNGTGSLARFGTGTTSSTYNYWYTGNDVGSFIEQQGNTTTAGSDKFRIQSSISGLHADYSQFIIDPINGFSFLSLGAGNSNVGIGTNSPAYKFHVMAAPNQATPVAFVENTSGEGESDGLYINAGSNTVAGAYFIVFYRPDGGIIGKIQQASSTGVQYVTVSDKRLKNIIGASQKGLSDLMKINIYDYTFKSDPNKKVQTGFMAQELYEIFPQAVSKPRENNEPAEKNPWMVDYGSVTPLIIKSVQEQQQMIDEQKEKIATLEDAYKLKLATLEERIVKLEAALATITANNNENVSNEITNGSLAQNKPNPFNKNTIIRYAIPQGSKGQINIYDPTGKLVKAFNANESDQLEISGHDLTSGTYTYTLMIDGKVALSKQMVIMK